MTKTVSSLQTFHFAVGDVFLAHSHQASASEFSRFVVMWCSATPILWSLCIRVPITGDVAKSDPCFKFRAVACFKLRAVTVLDGYLPGVSDSERKCV
ncbi:unnamed protein product [Phytophthora fragariaefolia]|uniref:Unnamed protein product n=1 Tax=Phytophthora fragariaefolia TaxID=1490495 RepID=A0A9W6X299_9STRA|nr:unnamed protein product [Phytophthora fragariaefolia]